jgi:hydrogenase-4 membrane subunit HyfE
MFTKAFKMLQNICAAITFVTLVAAIPIGILGGVPWLSVLATVVVISVVVGHLRGDCHE